MHFDRLAGTFAMATRQRDGRLRFAAMFYADT
jgi:hypothetical protein